MLSYINLTQVAYSKSEPKPICFIHSVLIHLFTKLPKLYSPNRLLVHSSEKSKLTEIAILRFWPRLDLYSRLTSVKHKMLLRELLI